MKYFRAKKFMKFYITNGNGSSSWVQQRSENMKASKRQIEGYKGATVLRSRPQYNCFLTLKLQKCGGASRISTYRFEETHVCYENTYSYIIISICCLPKKHPFLKLCSFCLKSTNLRNCVIKTYVISA